MSDEPLPAHVRVRVVADTEDYGAEGLIIGVADMQIGTKRGEWFIVLLDSGVEVAYQDDELETIR